MKTLFRTLSLLILSGITSGKLFAQTTSPNITYPSSSYVYTIGSSIGTLTPTNSNAAIGGTVPAQVYGSVTTLAGTTGAAGYVNATGTSARFDDSETIAVDPNGNMYVVDFNNNRIRKVTPAGVVTTFAGSGVSVTTNGIGTSAAFFGPNAIEIDPAGLNLYVADNYAIRKIVISTAAVTTVAGNGTGSGSANGTGTAASFNVPCGLAFDVLGANLYVADRQNNEIRKINLLTTAVTNYAGSTTAGTADGTTTAARFNQPYGMVNDGSNNLYLTDRGNNSIRKINLTTGAVTTFAGSTAGAAGYANGTGTAARFNNPKAIDMDGAGNMYITDNANNDIRKITPAGVVTLIAGSASQAGGTVDGVATAARFNGPFGITVEATGAYEGYADIVGQNDNNVRRLCLNGYTISPALPAGLNFDPTTGVITGTPTTTIGPTVYTVTAYNFWGSSSFNLTFEIDCIPSPVVTITQQVSCGGASNGVVTAVSLNATGYSIDGAAFQTSGTFAGVSPGDHTITATYSGTCTTSATPFTINGGPVTWAGTTSTDPNVATNWVGGVVPGFDGTEALIIPNVASGKYPVLTADESFYSLTISGASASLNLNGHNLNVGCNIVNAAGGLLTWGSNNASTLTWNGNSAQSYTGSNVTPSAQVGTMVINNSAAATVTVSAGPLDIYSALTLTSGSLSIGSTGTLTLKSSATQTCNVAALPGGSSISGNVTVERFVTGGTTYNAGRWVYRNYRLMSSPVNEGIDASSKYPYSLNYVAAKTIVTGATSSLGTVGGNQSLYLYKEAYTPDNKTFISGNFIGVINIAGTTSASLISTTDATNASGKMYVGTGYMMYFRGDNINNLIGTPSKTKYPYVAPESVVFSTSGVLNQGQYSVNSWTGTAGLLYTVSAGNTAVRGFNLVGNPYASTIDWSKFSNVAANASTAAIYGANVNPSIYILNPITNNYDTYSSTTNLATGSATKYIPSGQGFFVQANAASPTLVFREAAKSNTQVTGSSLLLGTPVSQTAYTSYMRLKLTVDSLNYDDMVVGFNSTSTNAFNSKEDAALLGGTASLESISSITSDSIKASVKWVPLPKTIQEVIKLNVTTKLSGTFTLSRTDLKEIPALYEIWLMDNMKKDSLDLKANDTYRFDVDLSDTNSYGSNRFYLVIRQNQALGVHLLAFNATKATAGAQTAWTTENEANYTNFTVERSTDNGATYQVISGVSSTGASSYSFLDTAPPAALDIYRLKIEDVNGAITYSQPVSLMYATVSTSIVSSKISLYPNPVKSTVNLNISPTSTLTTTPGYSPTKSAVAIASNLTASASATAATSGPALATSTQTILDPNASYAIKIVSMTGTVIKSISTTGLTWQSDLSALVPGTYIIQVVNNKDKSVVGKQSFIKL